MKYYFIIASAQVKSGRIRVLYLPSEGAGVAVAAPDRGDAMSVVVDLNGDTTDGWKVPWDAMAYAKANAINPNLTYPTFSLGRLQFQMEVPFKLNTITDSEILVYGAMDDDAKFYDPVDLTSLLVPNFLATTPPEPNFPGKSKSLTNGLFNESIREAFRTATFHSFVPMDQIDARGFLAGDYTNNFTDLLKRRTLELYAQNVDTTHVLSWNVCPGPGALGLPVPRDKCVSAKIYQLAPFIGYSGGQELQALYSAGTPSYNWIKFVDNIADTAYQTPRGAGGAIPFIGPSTASINVALPYSQSMSYLESFPSHNYELPRQIAIYGSNTTATHWDMFLSFMDDVSVYYPTVCPALTAYSVDLKGKLHPYTILPKIHTSESKSGDQVSLGSAAVTTSGSVKPTE